MLCKLLLRNQNASGGLRIDPKPKCSWYLEGLGGVSIEEASHDASRHARLCHDARRLCACQIATAPERTTMLLAIPSNRRPINTKLV